MPWPALLGGCLTAVAVSAAGGLLTRALQSPGADLLTGRASIAALLAGVSFLGAEPQRALLATLPVRGRVTTALRAALGLPAVALAAWYVIARTDAEVRIALGAGGAGQAAPLPAALAFEAAAGLALAFALACAVSRTRWADLGGIVAAPAALAAVAALAVAAPSLFPVPAAGATAGRQPGWPTADAMCGALTAIALTGACLATRDPWRRLNLRPGHGAC